MREGWKKVRLNDFVWFQRGYDLPKSKFKKGNIPVYGSTSVLGYHNVSKVKAPGIITGRSGSLGVMQYSGKDFWPHNTTLWVKDFKGNNERFAYYLLQSLDFASFNSGGAVPTLNRNVLNSFIVDVPPLKTQRQIASILSAYDDLIENNLKRIKLLEEQAQQTYEEWFVRFKFPGHETAEFDEESGLPVGWEIASLNDVSRINSKSLKKDFEGKIKYIDIASVSTGEINSTTSYNISDAPGRAKRIVKHGDIIWSCVRPNRKSYSVIWNPEQNLIASTGFCVITPKTLPTSYLLKYLTTDSYVAYLSNLAGGAAYPAVKAVDFKNSDVIIPEKSLIEKYDSIFKNSLELSSNLQAQNQLLKEARDILLPRLMMGIIDPSASSVDDVEWVDSDSYLKAAEERSNYKKST